MSDTPSDARDRREAAIRWLSRLLFAEPEAGGLSPGERAELRRADPRDALTPVMWRLLTAPAIAAATKFSRTEQDRVERAWALLIRTMVEAGTSEEARPVGQVLADPHGTRELGAAYSEVRFLRLLRARGLGETAHHAGQAARWCAAHGAAACFTDRYGADGFGGFLLAAALRQDAAERCTHAIARDYFANLPRDASAPES
ncbi:MAG: type I-E CRISPR-associated protein Cse2/CasB [Roseomonas mucosa]|uniref:type I-E CRISPR-associated protein Cse2/CasB n=1 Tax=Roseomonas mucosa TaxID=207340 RepID=UPI001EF6271A|nr:type I-E CRISPR-associated protein Cse2/CasB [Roseomonas mucosa]MCG7354430.1 type I-E CRISPR-associated protein Cse2/CasB [Roseomonas mucosa]MDU7522639.1 type I-E CRISPR-associated protein Cse2/CasB [Roseomonas mucosa]